MLNGIKVLQRRYTFDGLCAKHKQSTVQIGLTQLGVLSEHNMFIII